jgi:hypothetical protein
MKRKNNFVDGVSFFIINFSCMNVSFSLSCDIENIGIDNELNSERNESQISI